MTINPLNWWAGTRGRVLWKLPTSLCPILLDKATNGHFSKWHLTQGHHYENSLLDSLCDLINIKVKTLFMYQGNGPKQHTWAFSCLKSDASRGVHKWLRIIVVHVCAVKKKISQNSKQTSGTIKPSKNLNSASLPPRLTKPLQIKRDRTSRQL